MENLFDEIIGMTIDASWLIVAVLVARALLHKAPKYFRKILWGLVALRLLIPFSFESPLSLMPQELNDATQIVSQDVTDTVTQQQSVLFVDVLPYIWAVVTVLLIVYGIFSFIKLKRRIFDAVILEDNIYCSDKIESPFVCGFIKPKIYIPYGLDDKIRICVLEHEKTHIKYADHILKCLGFALLCVHWVNPLIWVSYFLFCKDIELSCDESVIKNYNTEKCKLYAKALLDMGVNKVRLSACPIAFGEVSIKVRIKSVMGYKKAGRAIVCISLCLCIAVAVCFMTKPEVQAKEQVESVIVEKTTTEPITEPVTKVETTQGTTTEPVTEPTTEPVTEIVTEVYEIVEEPTVDYEELNSIIESQKERLKEESLRRNEIIMSEANENSQNNFVFYQGAHMSADLVPTGNTNTVQYPTVSFPADNTPTYNYGNTNHPHFEGNQWVYN